VVSELKGGIAKTKIARRETKSKQFFNNMGNEVRIIFDGDPRPLFQVADSVSARVQTVAQQISNLGGTINLSQTMVAPARKAADELKNITTDITRHLKQEEKKRESDAKLTAKAAASEAKQAAKSAAAEVSAINQQTTANARQKARVLTEVTRQRVTQEIAEERRLARERKRVADSFLTGARSTGPGLGTAAVGEGVTGGLGVPLGAAAAITAVTVAATVGGKAVLDYSSKLEQAKIGFTTMTGSAVTAQKHLEDLQKFAATTPFRFDELVTASQQLQGVGFKSTQIIPILKDVGNALSAAGRIGDLPFAIKALGDIQAKGKLAGQEIIQLANAGIPIRDVLAKELGVTTAQVIKMGEDGQISADMVFSALHKLSESRFGDAMAAQSKTFAGAMSNIGDAANIAASKAFAPLYKEISKLANSTAEEVAKQGDDLTAIGITIGSKIAEGVGVGLGQIVTNIIPIALKALKGGIDTGFGLGPLAKGASNSILQTLGFSEEDIKKSGLNIGSLSETFKSLGDQLLGGDTGSGSLQNVTEDITTILDLSTFTIKQISHDVAQTPSLSKQLELQEVSSLLKDINKEQQQTIKAISRDIDSSKPIADLMALKARAENDIGSPQQISALQDRRSSIQSEITDDPAKLAKELAKIDDEIAASLERRSDLMLKIDDAIKESVEKGKEKVKELGKVWRSTFEDLSIKFAGDNPIAKVFAESDKALRELKTNIAGLPADLQKVAVKMQQAINARQLFSARAETTFDALDFRQKAQDLRDFKEPVPTAEMFEKALAQFGAKFAKPIYDEVKLGNTSSFSMREKNPFLVDDKVTQNFGKGATALIARDIRENMFALYHAIGTPKASDLTFPDGVTSRTFATGGTIRQDRTFDDLSETEKRAFYDRFKQTDPSAFKAQERFDLNLRAGSQLGPQDAEQQAIIDRRIASLGGSIGPENLRPDQREGLALVNERLAVDQERKWKEAQDARIKMRDYLGILAGHSESLQKKAESGGLSAVKAEITVKNESDSDLDVRTPNQESTNNYFNPGLGFGGGGGFSNR